MELIVVHLSDIHIKASTDPILDKADLISATLSGLSPKVAGCVVAVTGDISFAGTADELSLAQAFLGRLEVAIKKTLQLESVFFVVVPGNHDCNFSSPDEVREILVQNAVKSRDVPSIAVVGQCLGVQSEFFDFLQELYGELHVLDARAKLCDQRKLEVGTTTIKFILCNTAWMSQRHEVQGGLRFPVDAITEHSAEEAMVVTLFHHPYNWLEANNARAFRKRVEMVSDLVLTGHEHIPAKYVRNDLETGIAHEYLEGAVLQESATGVGGFNIALLDLKNKRQKLISCTWSDPFFRTNALEVAWQPYQRNRNRLRHQFEILDEFYERVLSDPGAGFTHPRKDRVTLADVYVEPNFSEVVSIDGSSDTISSTVSSADLRAVLRAGNSVAVFSEEAAGKTAFAKQLFVRLHAEGVLPVLVTARDFKGHSWEQVLACVMDAVRKQYGDHAQEPYRQQTKDKRFLILDDYHRSSLNARGKSEVMSHLRGFFGGILVLADEISRLGELSAEFGVHSALLGFRQFEMLEFGHQLREELVERWLTLGSEYIVQQPQLDRQVIRTKELVDGVLGRNLLPALPIFLLIILQQIEASTDLQTSNGAQGYLYEALITRALAQTAKRVDLDTAYNYLAEIANRLYENRARTLTAKQAEKLHRTYCETYQIALKAETLLDAFSAAGVLSGSAEELGFKYKYLYFYFVARYLRDRINTAQGSEKLKELVSTIHREESANILIFLSYLSKEPAVLREILRNSKTLYQGVAPCDFESHVMFANRLYERLPKGVLVDKDARTSRRELNKKMDDIARTERSVSNDELDDALKMNVAYKTIQVLGQIIRNFPGSITGSTKLKIVTECYFLGLRSMRVILRILESNSSQIVAFMADALKSKDTSQPAREKRAKRFITLLVEGVCFAVTKHVARSVGAEALEPTYEAVKRKYPDLSVAVIDLAIRMEHFRSFPEKEFEDAVKLADRNILANLVIRHLFIDHVYRFPVTRAVKQRCAGRLALELKTVNLIERERAQR